MRSSALAVIAFGLVGLGAGLGLLMPRFTDVELRIEPGGRTFRIGDAPPRPLPGTVTVRPREQRLVVENRDSVDRLVGVVLVPAGWRFTVPSEFCSGTGTGTEAVLIVR